MSISKLELLQEAYDRGVLPAEKKAMFEEAKSRGLLKDKQAPDMQVAQSSQELGLKGQLQERGAYLADIVDATQQGKQSIPEGIAQGVMGQVGAAGDIIGAGLGKLAKGAYNLLPEAGQKRISSDIQKFSTMAKPYAQQYQQNLEAYNKENPRAGRNFEAIRELGNVIPVGVAPGISKTAAKEAFSPFESALTALNTKTILPTGAELKEASSGLFKRANELGAQYTPDLINEFEKRSGALLPKGDVAKELIKPDAADEFIMSLEKVRGKSLTLDDFESIDRELGNKAHMAFQSDRELARKYSNMQADLRELVEGDGFVTGTKEGMEAHREATRLWSIGTKMNDIQRIVDDADFYEVPSTAIKTGFRRIARSDKLMRGYTAQERHAIRRAAKTGSLDGVFKTFGSRLMAIGGGAIGGMQGAALGYGISSGGRSIAESLRKGQAGKVTKQLGERSGLIRTEKRLSGDKLKAIMKMKPKDAQKALQEQNK